MICDHVLMTKLSETKMLFALTRSVRMRHPVPASATGQLLYSLQRVNLGNCLVRPQTYDARKA